jgi:hypothetical protein
MASAPKRYDCISLIAEMLLRSQSVGRKADCRVRWTKAGEPLKAGLTKRVSQRTEKEAFVTRAGFGRQNDRGGRPLDATRCVVCGARKCKSPSVHRELGLS